MIWIGIGIYLYFPLEEHIGKSMFMDLNQQHCLMSHLVFSLVPEGNTYIPQEFTIYSAGLGKKKKKREFPV